MDRLRMAAISVDGWVEVRLVDGGNLERDRCWREEMKTLAEFRDFIGYLIRS